ncbi:hypothetical protein JW905_08705 [bacterium]|nr:hypothetical protein [candidate division CSSED10-310 bacterium]
MGFEPRILGRTGMKVGRLGVAAAYGAPAAAFEEAFERGCNYFYWGSIRRGGMRDAVRNICRAGKRDSLVLVVQSFSRSAWYLERSVHGALARLGLTSVDVLLLGLYNGPPSRRIMERALVLKERGVVRCIGLSGHNRGVFPRFAAEGELDVLHVRYSAAHRGAEEEVFPSIEALDEERRPGLVSFTATRWGQLLRQKHMPPGVTAPRAADCYRFVLTNPAVDVCLSGPSTRAQMTEALHALTRGPMSEEELRLMRRIGDHLHGRVPVETG